MISANQSLQGSSARTAATWVGWELFNPARFFSIARRIGQLRPLDVVVLRIPGISGGTLSFLLQPFTCFRNAFQQDVKEL